MAGEVARLFISVGADVREALTGLNDVSGRLTRVGQTAAVTGGLLTAGLTLPLAGAAKEAVGSAMDVQQQMNILQAISGATDSQLQTLRQTAVDLGADMTLPATSAQDASAAMLELAKAGLSVDNVLGATKGTLMLAAAAHMSEADAAEVASNALNAFQLKGEDAMFVADQLAATANASSVEATDVAYSFRQAASAFSAFQSPALGAKGAITELNTAVGILGNMGLKGEMAGSALKMTLLELTAPTGQAKTLMAQLAQSVGESGNLAYNAAGQMRSLPEIMDILRRSTAAMTEEERNYTITKIFGADASKAVIALMQAGKQGWDEMEASVTKAGAAQDFTNASTKGLKGALDGLRSTVDTLLLEAGTPFLGMLEGWTRNLAGLLSGISAVDPRILAMAGTFLAVLAVTGPAVLAFGLMATALGFLLSPVGLVVLGIAALAALLAGNVGGIADFANSLGVLTQGFLSGSVSLGQFIGQIGLLLGQFLAPLRGRFALLLSQLGDLVPRIVAEGARLAEAFVAWVGPAAGEMVTALLDVGLQLIYWLAGQVGPIANQLLAWAKAFLDWIGPMAIQALNALLVFLGQVTTWIEANAPTLLATLIGEWVPAR
nr:phage tail tape measure protein [Dehalococcoidales bacterium]